MPQLMSHLNYFSSSAVSVKCPRVPSLHSGSSDDDTGTVRIHHALMIHC